MFVKDNDSASLVVSALPPNSRISAKVIKKEYLGIIRIDKGKGFDELNITGPVYSVAQAKCFEGSSVVQLSFKSQLDLDMDLKHGIKMCIIPLNQRVSRATKCQGFDPNAREYTNELKFGRCAGPHVNSHDNACSASTVKSANCGGTHRSNSRSCVVLKSCMPAAASERSSLRLIPPPHSYEPLYGT